MGNHKDFATGTVAVAPSPANSGTSLQVQAGEGSRYPAVPFDATVHPDNELPTLDNAEKVKVTAISTDTLTITRAQGETTAKSIEVGWRISNTIFAEDLINATGFDIIADDDAPSDTSALWVDTDDYTSALTTLDIIDEDNMVSDSATKIPTQQSVKAYVDSSSGGGGASDWGDLGGTLSDQTDLQSALDDKADTSSLATVATSGDYDDLTDKPTIPTNNNQLTNGAGYITDYTVTESDVTDHEAALSITESQISDLGDYATDSDLTTHTTNTTNPHSVTKTQVGLGNVDNTSDASKPVSTATQTALDGKANSTHTHVATTDLTATGTKSSATYLRGDNTWNTPTNTTYTEISEAEITTGTATTLRTISGRRAGFLKNRANHTGTQTLSTISDAGTAASKNIHVGTTAPSSPSVGDLWVDTN